MITRKELCKIIEHALKELRRAIEELNEPTFPLTPLPRFRVFEIAPGIKWTGNSYLELERENRAWPNRLYLTWSTRVSEVIVEQCKSQPRLVLRALRRIQAATAWCKRRRGGRLRMAEEILRQQESAVRALKAEATLIGLKEL